MGHWHAGLSREKEDESFELEASQGDRIVGIISRQEVAAVTAAALDSPASAGTDSALLPVEQDTSDLKRSWQLDVDLTSPGKPYVEALCHLNSCCRPLMMAYS